MLVLAFAAAVLLTLGARGPADDAAFCAEAPSALRAAGEGDVGVHGVRVRRLERVPTPSGHDVTSARGWMERIERCEGAVRGAGAYTVLRSDAVSGGARAPCEWRVWGGEFHRRRLRASYEMLLAGGGRPESGVDDDADAAPPRRPHFDTAQRETEAVIAALLDAASGAPSTEPRAARTTRTLMVTLLWTPPETTGGAPVVRGHASFAGPARAPGDVAPPAPVAARLALPREATPEALSRLPRRRGADGAAGPGASAKASSWCRRRRPLEGPRFKPPGPGGRAADEVLLVRQGDDAPTTDDFLGTLDILEGLTSNFFAVYDDGTVRTAPAGDVLSGYARHLVLAALTEGGCGDEELTLDPRAPRVRDARAGRWVEAFVTSAVRLVVPVERVLLPPLGDDGDEEETALWQVGGEHRAHPLTRAIRAAVRERGEAAATRVAWPGAPTERP